MEKSKKIGKNALKDESLTKELITKLKISEDKISNLNTAAMYSKPNMSKTPI